MDIWVITPRLDENCFFVREVCVIAKESKSFVTQEAAKIENLMSWLDFNFKNSAQVCSSF